MQCFLKSRTRFTAKLPTSIIHHPTPGVHTSFDHCRRLAANDVRRSRRFRTSMLGAYSAGFKGIEGRWCKHLQEQSAAWLKVFDEMEVMWIERSDVEHAEMRNRFQDQLEILEGNRTQSVEFYAEWRQEYGKEVEELVLQSSDLLDAALEERKEMIKLEGKYNVHGALGCMVYLAKLHKKVPLTAGVQEGLNELAQSGEFTAILNKEVKARKLDVRDVMACVDSLYRKAYDRTRGNDGIITVRATKFNDNERAALVVFLKVQSNWPSSLSWQEDTSCKRGK